MKHFVSDTHFGHANVIRYSNRPYSSVHDMNESMIAAWNNHVAQYDDVYHLGDFAFMNITSLIPLLSRLNGRIHVISGNHDKVLWQNATRLIADGLIVSLEHYKELRHDGEFFVLSHYGMRTWNKAHHGAIHLFGHTHGSLPPLGKSVDVGVDDKNITDEYRPVSVDEVLRFMRNRQSHTLHHDGEG